MPDFHSPEDEATLYVLGELTVADRRKFEARLAESAELRALVRELEEGAVALSTALPQRRPPAEVWSGIEKAVCRDNRRSIPAWWMSLWRSGWTAAAVCLAGWVLYAILWNGRGNSKPPATQSVLQPEITIANSSPAPQQAVAVPLSPTNADRQLLQVRAGEIRDLRVKVAEMERQTNELSQLLAQERARLGETNRIKFYHLTSAASGDASASQFSPAMQRAVLISIGRELGWFPAEPKSRIGGGRAASTVDGIDFVDLRPPNNGGGNQPVSQPQTESQIADASAPSIPAFVSGDKLIVGLDSTIVPPNSSVTVTVASANAAPTGGTLVTGDNPTVVTVPLSAGVAADGGFTVTVYSVAPSGMPSTNQFFASPSP
ncbi:MAG TPA: hypothetical protein VHC44_02470 [Verrucomicrobiae bacterium]|nr:hypothetical protein [Verrucomicrobiae bacterium]